MARFSFPVKMQCFLLLLPYLISFQDGVILINCLHLAQNVMLWFYYLSFFFFPLATWLAVYGNEQTLP